MQALTNSYVASSQLEDLPRLFAEEWHLGAQHLWCAVLFLRRINADDAWVYAPQPAGRPFRSVNEWALSLNLPGLNDKTVVSKFIRLVTDMDEIPELVRPQLFDHSVWNVLEVLPVAESQGAEAAHEVLASPATTAQKRQKVREITSATQHQDFEYRTYSVKYPFSLDDLKRRVLNRARFEAHLREPPDTALFEWILTTCLQDTLSPEMEKFRELIEGGEFKCRNCGSWDARELEGHHVRAKSAQGHKMLVVILCRSCHHIIQPRWREWAEEQGYPEEVWSWQ